MQVQYNSWHRMRTTTFPYLLYPGWALTEKGQDWFHLSLGLEGPIALESVSVSMRRNFSIASHCCNMGILTDLEAMSCSRLNNNNNALHLLGSTVCLAFCRCFIN